MNRHQLNLGYPRFYDRVQAVLTPQPKSEFPHQSRDIPGVGRGENLYLILS